MKLDLGPIFSRAFRLAWVHRSLWVYGFLLALFGGECARFGSAGDFGGDEMGEVVSRLQRTDPNTLLSILLVAGFALALFWLLSVVVGNWSLGALIAGLHQAETEGATSFPRSSRAGRGHFWPLLVVGFVTGLVGLALAFPAIASAIFAALTDQPLFIGIACLWLPVAMVVWLALGLLATVAQIHIVLSGAGPFAGLRFAWRFLTGHTGDLLLVWAANDVGVGCAAGCVTSLLVVIASVPAVIGFMINPVFGFILLVPTVIMVLAIMFGRGIVAVFQRAIWLLAYQQLESDRGLI